MRLVLTLLLVLAAAAGAFAEGGLGGALDSQRRAIELQRGEARREIDAQRRDFQQQQEQTLRFQLLQRQEPLQLTPRPLICTRAGSTLLCQ